MFFYFRIIILLLIFNATAFAQLSMLTLAKKTNNIDTSITICINQLNSCELKMDTSGIIETSCYLSNLYTKKSKYAKAEKIITDALELVKSKKFEIKKALLISELASIYKFELNPDDALTQFFIAKDLFKQNKDWKNYTKTLIDIAEFYRYFLKYDDAQSYINMALAFYTKKNINDTLNLIRIYNRAAAIATETEKFDESLKLSSKALLLAQKIKNKNLEATSINENGVVYRNLKKVEEAEACFKNAEHIWFSIGADREALNALQNRMVLYANNEIGSKKIIPIYNIIMDYVTNKNIEFPVLNINRIMYLEYKEIKDYQNSNKYMELYLSTYQKIEKSKYASEIANINEKYKNKEIRKQVTNVTDELKNSTLILEQKKRQNAYTNLLLVISLLFLCIIGYLFQKNQKKNQILLKKNNEKDALIQEIHHRVKNNLQFVSSLINMQINSTSGDDNINTLKDTSRRIKTMALVHEMLYNQDTIGTISVKKYLEELIQSLQEFVSSHSKPIKLELDIEDAVFDVTKCIALGMITSELVSNSMKHAFKTIDYPTLTISLKKAAHSKSNELLFCLKDNGTGFEKSNQKIQNLGMRLIDIFSRELKGKFKFENNNGLIYTLTFNI